MAIKAIVWLAKLYCVGTNPTCYAALSGLDLLPCRHRIMLLIFKPNAIYFMAIERKCLVPSMQFGKRQTAHSKFDREACKDADNDLASKTSWNMYFAINLRQRVIME